MQVRISERKEENGDALGCRHTLVHRLAEGAKSGHVVPCIVCAACVVGRLQKIKHPWLYVWNRGFPAIRLLCKSERHPTLPEYLSQVGSGP